MPPNEPTREQIERLRSLPNDTPVVMVNLLRFKPDGGREMFEEYTAVAGRVIEELGGSIIFRGDLLGTVIGGDEFDAIALVSYPSIASFFELQRNPEYVEVVELREGSLEEYRLYAVTE